MRGDADHPLSHGYTCAKGRALPAAASPPGSHRAADDARRRGAAADDVGNVPRRSRRTAAHDHRPARTGRVGIFFGSGVGMDAAGYRMTEALHAGHRHAGEVQPAHDRRHRQGARVSTSSAASAGLNPTSDYDHARLVVYVGINPVVSHGHNDRRSPIRSRRSARAASARGGLGRRPAPDRDRAARRRATSRHGRAPTTRCSHSSCASCCDDGADGDVLEHRTVEGEQLVGGGRAVHAADHAAQIAGVAECGPRALLAAVRRAGRVAIDTGTGVTMARSAPT